MNSVEIVSLNLFIYLQSDSWTAENLDKQLMHQWSWHRKDDYEPADNGLLRDSTVSAFLKLNFITTTNFFFNLFFFWVSKKQIEKKNLKMCGDTLYAYADFNVRIYTVSCLLIYVFI